MTTPERAAPRRRPVALAVAIVVVLGCWVLGNPRSSGPDEPSHMVASAGLVRGDLDGEVFAPDPALRIYDVPGMVGAPDPGCWAQQPNTPVDCANVQVLDDETTGRASTSSNYAPWAYVLPGAASYVSWAGGYAYLARAASALVPALLVGLSLLSATSERRLLGAAALVGATPIVWFTFGTVNPSAVAIAGGLALWTGLLVPRGNREQALAVAGWVALLVARRDGPLWATAIVLAVCALFAVPPGELVRRLDRRARWVAAAAVPLPLLPVLDRGDRGFNLLLALAPVGLLAVEGFVRLWQRQPTTQRRAALASGSAAIAAVAVAVAVSRRPGGFDTDTIRLIVTSTGDHLQQLVGVLGWLDAPVPTTAVLLYWAALGGLAAVAAIEVPRVASIGSLALLGLVLTAWLLELGQGADYGRYWQGRYSMPFAIGLPLVLAWRPSGAGLVDRLAPHLGWASWIVLNAGFFAAQRRWAVGIDGSWYPWRWDTWGSPLPPWILVVVHLAATAGLVLVVLRVDREPAAA